MNQQIIPTDTVAAYIAMPATEREAAYRALRNRQSDEYNQRVGPRASRSRWREVEQRRAAGGRHAQTADRLERRIEQERDEYDRNAVVKHCLAVLTGRYDVSVRESGYAGGYGNPDAQAMLVAAVRGRVRELAATVTRS